MNDYYKIISSCDPNADSFSLTLLSGDAAGEKAVISNGEFTFLSDKDDFFKKNADRLKELSDCGIVDFAGEEVYIERIGHRKKLVVCGCGHVSLPVIRLGKMLGFHITAIDDRAEFTINAKEAGADSVIALPFREALDSVEGDAGTYFVIVTRGHHYDEECLKSVSSKPHAYIGMMGSGRRAAVVRENLIAEGLDRGVMESVHSPIGLSIGSETPEEIAVSIFAEIIQEKRKLKDSVFPEDILRAVIGTGHSDPLPGKKALATIIKKKGSAPREVGTKMLILENGERINTIGGGSFEAGVIKAGVEMLKSGKMQEILRFELSADAASIEGEVCGGELYVLLEMIR